MRLDLPIVALGLLTVFFCLCLLGSALWLPTNQSLQGTFGLLATGAVSSLYTLLKQKVDLPQMPPMPEGTTGKQTVQTTQQVETKEPPKDA